MFNSFFKNASVFAQFLTLLAVIALSRIIALMAGSLLILVKFGFSVDILEIQQHIADYPDMLRGIQFLQELGVFIFPAVICAGLFSDNYKEYLHIDSPVYFPVVVWTSVSIISVIPFLNFTYYFNRQMVLPEALKGLEVHLQEMEQSAAQLTEAMLATDNWEVQIFNIILMCVLAAVGEEFMFRGMLQNLFGRFVRNPHIVIWTVAVLFSAFHLQFYGFVPRLLLGAYLGYLLYYTKTIWIPVVAHFVNNLFGVLSYYVFQDDPQRMQEIDTVGTGATEWVAIVSLVVFIFCFRQIKTETSKI
ncbi:MAG: CPBP family intramembrane metalloprotease [Dysgonamonadaceae bacterium]|jgi:membrane protease YdiL (CAAX protease family)|nr:CPBP family intramembrane metalloprotease [Dysgonamonadaceae bacterium]